MSGLSDLRLTTQRQAVLNAVQHSANHPDAAEVYEHVRASLPRVSLGTVYRALDALVEAGFLLRIETSGPARYDANVEPAHHHLTCARCGAVVDIPVTRAERQVIDEARRARPELRVSAVRLDFRGLCPVCRDAEERG